MQKSTRSKMAHTTPQMEQLMQYDSTSNQGEMICQNHNYFSYFRQSFSMQDKLHAEGGPARHGWFAEPAANTRQTNSLVSKEGLIKKFPVKLLLVFHSIICLYAIVKKSSVSYFNFKVFTNYMSKFDTKYKLDV